MYKSKTYINRKTTPSLNGIMDGEQIESNSYEPPVSFCHRNLKRMRLRLHNINEHKKKTLGRDKRPLNQF